MLLPRTGARLLAPGTRTVIDIGGQDSKVIQLDDDGNLSDFLMNDKCAAGTGRFLKHSRTPGASVSSRCDYHWRRTTCHHQHARFCRVRGYQPCRAGDHFCDQRDGPTQREFHRTAFRAGSVIYRGVATVTPLLVCLKATLAFPHTRIPDAQFWPFWSASGET